MSTQGGNGTVGLCVAPRPPRNRASTTGCHSYVSEILAHAGVWTTPVATDGLGATLGDAAFAVLVIAGDAELADGRAGAVAEWVAAGGALVAVGSTAGLDKLLGVRSEVAPHGFAVGTCTLGEGWIGPPQASHPIFRRIGSSLHFFNGAAVQAASAQVIACVCDRQGQETSRAAITVRRHGKGVAVLIAPDIPGSVALIQQGRSVDQDGVPAPDGTAPLSDNVLKADDGLVLDWSLDRSRARGVPYPLFVHPVADDLREVLLRAVLFAAREVGASLPLLWYYPRNLPALAHLSHDSDGNDPDAARRMLALDNEMGVRATWCVLMAGYSPDIYESILAGGHEIGFHFDALEQGDLSEWRQENLGRQHATLASGLAHTPKTNKNHYTRWEGRLEFFRWCVGCGITTDQSRGPSKVGAAGFPFGTSHPYFPMDDDGNAIDCLELGFASQDFVVFGPAEAIAPLVQSAADAHGVAHVIFHPAHCHRPEVAAAQRAFVRECRQHGMEFWTSAEIDAWERARRQVRLVAADEGWHVTSEAALPQATMLVPCDEAQPDAVTRFGLPFRVEVRDLVPGTACVVRAGC